MSGHFIDELMNWLECQIEAETTFGDQSLDIEQAVGSARVVSTGHYQRAVAYKKCVQKIRHLVQESHGAGNDHGTAAKE